ncbi:hypothetical protein GQ54DRAFT_294764 [Martensiomyces pterosporus]|nr:hypothetical protein GQ54DRAFT_294764 [Martensiomyces pterosporus]
MLNGPSVPHLCATTIGLGFLCSPTPPAAAIQSLARQGGANNKHKKSVNDRSSGPLQHQQTEAGEAVMSTNAMFPEPGETVVLSKSTPING